MQRMKKSFIWMILMALVVSMVPGFTPAASAADAPTSFFTPDIKEIRDTTVLKPADISRDNIKYHATESSLTVTGTYSKVTGSTLGVNVQQLIKDPKTELWVEDPTHVAPGVMQLDLDNPENRFKANLTLFSGVNKITFTGSQGLVERSETFYVIYDTVPYIEKLQVLGGAEKLDLNESAQMVIPRNQITLEGKAQNATKVTISANGEAALATTLLQDGSFFTPQLQLNPGLNSLKLVVQNASDSVTFNYQIIYYDDNNPVVGMYLTDSTNIAQSLLTGVRPTFTDDANKAKLYVQVLVPDYNGTPFKGSADVALNGNSGADSAYYQGLNIDASGKLTEVGDSEILIPSLSNNTPSYRLVTFSIDTLPFKTNTDGKFVTDQEHSLSIKYGSKTINKTFEFRFLKGNTVISDMKYLKGYNETDTNLPAGEPLNGAKVDSSDFYILVTTNSKPADPDGLVAQYLPLGTKGITIKKVKDISDTRYIYKITGFQNGNQTVRFNYTGSDAYKDVTISFASKSYIYVANLVDGQTYNINSSNLKDLTVEGQFIGFDLQSPYFVADMTVNGLTVKSTTGESPTQWVDKTNGDFKVQLKVSNDDSGDLVHGENRIIIRGTSKEGEIKKELRIYVVDENVSTISKFQPAAGKDRIAFPIGSYNFKDATWTKILNLTPDFIFKDNKYTTSLKNYDLVFRGSGATKANLKLGSSTILSVDIPKDNADNANVTFGDGSKTYAYNFAGSQNDFVMRIQDLVTDMPGTYVYTLELINSTGAKTSQKVELVREESPYRIISPQPSVGDQYVMTKNFVHFDIEAEGATSVVIDKQEAVKRPDLGENRFVLDYVGLKQDKSNKIKIDISRGSVKITDTIEIFYTGTVAVDAEYMAPKTASKYSVFNKKLELSFPKGTVMQSTDTKGINKYYPDTKLLFGIADPSTGLVERRNDYGNIIGFPGTGEDSGVPYWRIPDEYLLRFASTDKTSNFGRISDVYWISGGLGEGASKEQQPATDGLQPYSVEAFFGDPEIPAERKITPSQRGTLTLSYDPNVVDEAGYTISVFRYNDKREWENIGGEVDAKKHTIAVPFDQFGYYKVMKLSRSYPDITNHGWARNVLNALYSKGIMNSVRFNQFGADDQTSRGEFATLIVKGLNLPINDGGQQTFADLVPGSSSATWDYSYIETATRAGIVTGLTDGIFAPDQPITREQAAVMIARALKLKLAVNDQKLKDAVAKQFLDSGKIDNYALPAIQAVTKAKIMAGSEVTVPGQKKASYNFNPKSNMTRAEAAKIAVELLKKSGNVVPKNLS